MDGILPLWKERGMTSHDCVFKLRKILHMKKIGHGGTLDPDVDGVLPVCLGKGTKVIEYLTDAGKIYEGEITLGFSTTTEDASGEVVARTRLSETFSIQKIDQAMASFSGEITQIPPMYSAVKVNGRKLYEYARKGESVERPARQVTIKSFRRTSEPVWNEEAGEQSWRFRVECGKGTYVRTLAVDTGRQLGVAAHMSDLTRTASGGFTASQAVTLAQVAEAAERGTLDSLILPIEQAVTMFKRIDLSEELWLKVKNGVKLAKSTLNIPDTDNGQLAVFYQDKLVGIYQEHPEDVTLLKPSKIIRTEI